VRAPHYSMIGRSEWFAASATPYPRDNTVYQLVEHYWPSDLNLNPHFHMLYLNGVYDAVGYFDAPTKTLKLLALI
jgi:hypothetical protein